MGSRRSPRDGSHGKEKRRSRTGCLTCRSRKVKCDERPGGCANCARLNFSCSYGPALAPQNRPVPSTPQTTEPGPRRLRTYRSCAKCRWSKSRCSGERPTCRRCLERNFECFYDGKQVPAWVETGSSSDAHASRTRSSPEPELGFKTSSLPRPRAESRESSRLVRSIFGGGEPPDSSGPAGPKHIPEELSWLMSTQLPSKDRIELLMEVFFSSFHSIRCFGFIHKPSYMRQLYHQSSTAIQGNALIHSLCALGAKLYALKFSDRTALPEDFALQVGNQWASKAHTMLLMNLNGVSVENAMAVVLLHEHELRTGSYATAFMLSGLAVRMAQVLQINHEKPPIILSNASPDEQLDWSSREARRRLMWSIYIMDSVASGIDEMTLVAERDIKIQLPCDERSFTLQIPCIVQTLEQGEHLSVVSAEDRAKGPVEKLDIPAHFIRLLSLRRKILRYIRQLDTAMMPWLPNSEFARLTTSLFSWFESLPGSLQLTQTTIHMRKEFSQLGALLMLHLTYQQTFCDLNRFGIRELFQMRRPFIFPPEQVDFQKEVQDRCLEHATGAALIFREALQHGREAFPDAWLPVIAHDAIRFIAHYTKQELGTFGDKRGFITPHAFSCIETSLEALKLMVPMFRLAKPLYAAALVFLRKKGWELPELAEAHATNMPTTQEPTSPFSSDYGLGPQVTRGVAQKEIQSKGKLVQESWTPAHILPDNPEPRLESGSSDVIATEDNFELPNGMDSIQAYFPLMYNNFNLPIAGSFGDH